MNTFIKVVPNLSLNLIKVLLIILIKWELVTFIRKVLLLTLGVFLLSGTLYAREESLHSPKNNAFSLKLGYHLYEESSVMDFWGFNENDFDSFVTAIAYERKISKRIGIELSVGYFRSSNTYGSVLLANDSSRSCIKNIYVSPSAKFHLPAGDAFVFYAGMGPDWYNTTWEYEYKATSFTYKEDDSFSTFGLHGLGGVEYHIMKKPGRDFFDAPLSLFLEYRYTWIEIDDCDEKAINGINRIFGTSFPKHDLDIGGHMIFLGLRWDFN